MFYKVFSAFCCCNYEDTGKQKLQHWYLLLERWSVTLIAPQISLVDFHRSRKLCQFPYSATLIYDIACKCYLGIPCFWWIFYDYSGERRDLYCLREVRTYTCCLINSGKTMSGKISSSYMHISSSVACLVYNALYNTADMIYPPRCYTSVRFNFLLFSATQ